MDQLRMETEKNGNQPNERFKFKEPIVLIPIICLPLLRGILSNVELTRLFQNVNEDDYHIKLQLYEYYSILSIFGVLPGIMLVAFLLEVYGRKPAFMLLYILCLLSAILSYVPYRGPFVFENLIVSAMKGGVVIITTLSICEYSRPKHRFAYLVAAETLKILGAQVIQFLYNTKILSNGSPYVSLGVIVIALACLGSMFWWPESPYWLASQGRGEDSKSALLWLRPDGDEARSELQIVTTARRRASPKLFWLSLLITILFVTVAKCSSSVETILLTVNSDASDDNNVTRTSLHTILAYFGTISISFLLILASYVMRRKVIYLCASVIPFLYVFSLTIWVYTEQIKSQAYVFYITVLICHVLIECGPGNLTFALFIETIPQKYYTYMSCIYSLCLYVSTLYFPTLSMRYSYTFPFYISLFLYTIVALLVVILIYWLSPETRGKHLLQIEKEYFDRHYVAIPEQVEDIEFMARL